MASKQLKRTAHITVNELKEIKRDIEKGDKAFLDDPDTLAWWLGKVAETMQELLDVAR